MTTGYTYAGQERKNECFYGEVSRDCSSCIAHPNNGGDCCFGTLYDPNDSECIECYHSRDCREVHNNRYRRTPLSRVPVSRIPVAPRQTVRTPPAAAAATRRPGMSPAPVGGLDESVVTKRYDPDEEPIIKRIGKEGVWGALTGSTFYLYKYFSGHFWP